ncbi:MAG: LamG domain-containing protein [Candidatus Paceibacterota bacterium]
MSKSFTLIEILVVIVIIGIISAFIIVSMVGVSNRATIAKGQVFANSKNSLLINLVSEWKLEGDTNDSWGANNGTWSGPLAPNTAVNYRPASECVSGQCLDYDGADDTVNVAHNENFQITKTGKLTVGCWFKTRELAGTAIIHKSNEWMFYPVLGGEVRFMVRNTSAWLWGDAYSSVELDKWYYAVGTANYSGGSLNWKLYINGVEYGDNTVVTELNTTTGNLVIGSTWTERFYGLLDEVRIFNEVVPADKIKEDYYSGLNRLLVKKEMAAPEYFGRIFQFSLATE